jgi:uncharacterized Zn-finger protein
MSLWAIWASTCTAACGYGTPRLFVGAGMEVRMTLRRCRTCGTVISHPRVYDRLDGDAPSEQTVQCESCGCTNMEDADDLQA